MASKKRMRFKGRSGDTYYWEAEVREPNDSRVEQIRCHRWWFWSKGR